MISKLKGFVKARPNDVILALIVALLIMLAFSVGYILAKNEIKEPIRIQTTDNL